MVVITPPSRPLLARTKAYQIPDVGEENLTKTPDVHDRAAADVLDPARVRSAVDPDLPDDAWSQAESRADPDRGGYELAAILKASRIENFR
jgi:hypothetical protein